MRIQWLADRAGYTATFGPALRIGSEIDAWLASKETFDGYCTACRGIRTFKVFGGAWFGERPNLREGMVCTSCCLSNRQRFILAAAEETWPSPTPRLLLMERFSALYPALRGRYRNVVASEFLGPDVAPGAVLERRGERVRHENATNLSFSDHSLDGIVHNDVLEHIADYRRTFAEAFRALRPGGVLLFTCPFFAERDVHLVRAVVQPDASVRHLEPPELHGDPLSDKGILAFYHFGWSLLTELADAGFADARAGMVYEPLLGLPASGHPDLRETMLPTVFRAAKPA